MMYLIIAKNDNGFVYKQPHVGENDNDSKLFVGSKEEIISTLKEIRYPINLYDVYQLKKMPNKELRTLINE